MTQLLRATLLAGVMLASASPGDVSAEGGRAAFYDPSYSVADWEAIARAQASWGNAIDGWELDPNGFYCVKPGMLIGQRLWLHSSSGVSASCTIGDMVQSHHVASWQSKWVVEVSWNLFVHLGLLQHNHVEVAYALPRPVVTEWYFEETGHKVSAPFWEYWNRFGDFELSVTLFGYPISEAETDKETGLITQSFERAVFEEHPNGMVVGQRVGVHACGAKENENIHVPEELEAAGGRYFSKTGHAVWGEFLEFWEQFGDERESIMTLGYPVSELFRSKDGLLAQCFERSIMELHSDGVVRLRRIAAELS